VAPSLFWGFNLGLLLTIAMLVVHGMMQVNGHPDASPVISGTAGLGPTRPPRAPPPQRLKELM